MPFTLQMFAMAFAIVVLTPREALAAIAGYLALGAVGVPVFSGMRGGVGVLAGPTGGFIWGFFFGVAAAVLLLHVVRDRTTWGTSMPFALTPRTPRAGLRRLGDSPRSCGCLSSRSSRACCSPAYRICAAGLSSWPLRARLLKSPFVTCIAPFLVVDFVKILAAVACARVVRAAVR